MNAAAWRLTLAAAVLMGLVIGGRTAFGLFVSSLNTASGMGLAALSFALALGQLAIGLAQPVVGILADRHGASKVIFAGAALLALPVTPMLMLGFALVMGASHMATLPPTTQLIARQHGVQRLGTLIGFVMLVHQVGSFAGIWLGGWAAEATGSDQLLWFADAALALGAAALVWPGLAAARRRVPAAA